MTLHPSLTWNQLNSSSDIFAHSFLSIPSSIILYICFSGQFKYDNISFFLKVSGVLCLPLKKKTCYIVVIYLNKLSCYRIVTLFILFVSSKSTLFEGFRFVFIESNRSEDGSYDFCSFPSLLFYIRNSTQVWIL